MNTVRDLGYAPNFGARVLAAKRTNTFGAIIPTMENAIFARGVQAFQDELRKDGITLLVASSSYNPEQEEEQIRSLVTRGAEALLLIGQERTPQIYTYLEGRRIPFVVAWVYDETAPRISIGFDNRLSMKSLANEVFALGHRDIGVITADRKGNDRARERFDGIREAADENGLAPESLHVEETTYAIDHGVEAFTRLMQLVPRPTAVLCGNDVFAAGALLAAKNLGLRVPEDVSVTGFDDIEIAEIVTPSLTTVHVPHREMGRRAAQQLVSLRAGDDPGPSVELETSIKWRESLGPVPAEKRQRR